jgi:hypothetical protein
MEKPGELIEALYERVEKYSTLNIKLAKLKAIETASKVAITLIAKLSVVVVLIIFVLVLNTGVALFLGECLGKLYYGFFIVALFYLILGIILHFFLHKWLKKPISSMIISQILQ